MVHASLSELHARATELVERLHAAPQRTVYAFAGAGAQALAWLHGVGGSSRTVLEALDAYHPASLADALGAPPTRAASAEVAAALARRSLRRAEGLVAGDPVPGPVFGLGLAATIATDRAKRGAHRVHVAAAGPLGLAWEELRPEKGARDRPDEEALASLLALHAAADASGVLGLPPLPLADGDARRRGLEPAPEFAAFLADRDGLLALDADGRPAAAPAGEVALVSGSFHPAHEGHLRLAEAAAAHLGRPTFFELPLANADKGAVDAADARRRAAQFAGVRAVLLTHAPLFVEKARRLPGSVFVVGVDTARRVLEPRFYGGRDALLAALAAIRETGCRFLVAGRAGEEGFRPAHDLDVPAGFEGLFEPLPAFRVDVSSTELRAAWP